MRFPQPVRMAEGGDGPVWARQRRRSGGPPLVGLLVTLVALFGALMLVLSIKEKSVAKAGAQVDGWTASAWGQVKTMTGRAGEKTEKAAEEAKTSVAQTAEKTGDAVKAGADKTADELKKS